VTVDDDDQVAVDIHLLLVAEDQPPGLFVQYPPVFPFRNLDIDRNGECRAQQEDDRSQPEDAQAVEQEGRCDDKDIGGGD